MLQLTMDQLNYREYDLWSKMCNRDVKFKEVSDNGYFCTNADLKKEIAKFKKNNEKNEYIKTKINDKLVPNVEYITENCVGVSKLDLFKIKMYSYKDLLNIYLKDKKSLETIVKLCLNSETFD